MGSVTTMWWRYELDGGAAMRILAARRKRREAERLRMSEVQRLAADSLPAMTSIAVLLLMLATQLPWPSWFHADRVGSAGEWFTGIVTAIVLLWALLEPHRQDDRDRKVRDAVAAEKAVRAIYSSGIRHQDPLPDALGRASRRLYDELEIQREVISNDAVSRRMRSFMVFLAYVFDDRKRGQVSEDLLFAEVRIVADSCKAQLFAVWRNEDPPAWRWPDDPRGDDGDPVEHWIEHHLRR